MKLHEKKLSDFRRFTSKSGKPDSLVVTDDEWGGIPFKVLKSWAISIVKEIKKGYCWCHEEYHLNEWFDKNECGDLAGFLIYIFEPSEEDL